MDNSSDSSFNEFLAELDQYRSTQSQGEISSLVNYPLYPPEDSQNEMRTLHLDFPPPVDWKSQLDLTRVRSERDYYQEQLEINKMLVKRLVQMVQSSLSDPDKTGLSRFEIKVTQKSLSIEGLLIQGWIWSKPVHTEVQFSSSKNPSDHPQLENPIEYLSDRTTILSWPYSGRINLKISRRRSHLRLTVIAKHIN